MYVCICRAGVVHLLAHDPECAAADVSDEVVTAVSSALYTIDPQHLAMRQAGYLSVTPPVFWPE
jgi:hypothetical protein